LEPSGLISDVWLTAGTGPARCWPVSPSDDATEELRPRRQERPGGQGRQLRSRSPGSTTEEHYALQRRIQRPRGPCYRAKAVATSNVHRRQRRDLRRSGRLRADEAASANQAEINVRSASATPRLDSRSGVRTALSGQPENRIVAVADATATATAPGAAQVEQSQG